MDSYESDYPESTLVGENGGSNNALSSCWKEIFRVVFRGQSAFDAWLTPICNFQIAQVLLTLPCSFAQMGMVSGILFQLLYGFMGCWSCYMTTSLYSDYLRTLEGQNARRSEHIIQVDNQWYEVLGGLLGQGWKLAGLIINFTLILCTATIQLVACSRLWVFLGIFMTSYTAWYMTVTAIFHEKVQNVTHAGPTSSVQYFTGTTNILYTFGSHALTLEIMDAMHEPRTYKTVYLLAVLYIFTLTLPSAISVYWRFGDLMLLNSNALAVFPPSPFRQAATILMLAHQFIEFAAFAIPIFAVWEKLLGVHHSKNYLLKCIIRIPVILFICLLALLIPFFGTINSVVGSCLSSIAVYIFPCVAFIAARRSPESRKNAVEQPPAWLPSWVLIYCINLGVILWVSLVGLGLGSWASIHNLLQNIHSFGFFAKCYECNPAQV